MECFNCKTHRGISVQLRVTHTYQAGGSARTQRAVCPQCGTVHTLLSEIVAVDPSKGAGAAALAKKKAAPARAGAGED